MFGNNFYFGSIRKYIVLFGSLFNDILIDRVNEAGDAVDTLKVPLSYGPKDRYLVRLQENPDLLRRSIRFYLECLLKSKVLNTIHRVS